MALLGQGAGRRQPPPRPAPWPGRGWPSRARTARAHPHWPATGGVLFVVGGVGVAPARAMIEHLDQRHSPVVLYRARSLAEATSPPRVSLRFCSNPGAAVCSPSSGPTTACSPTTTPSARRHCAVRGAGRGRAGGRRVRPGVAGPRRPARPLACGVAALRHPLRAGRGGDRSPALSPRHPSLARRALPAGRLAGAGGLLLLERDDPASARWPRQRSPALRSNSGPGGKPPVTPSSAPAAASGSEQAGTVPSTVPGPRPLRSSAASQSCGTDETGPAVQTRFGPGAGRGVGLGGREGLRRPGHPKPGGASDGRSPSTAHALPILHDRAVQVSRPFRRGDPARPSPRTATAPSLQAILDGWLTP